MMADMRRRLRSLLIMLAGMFIATPASQAEPRLEVDPHGAVLCVWSIYVAARHVGEVCLPGENGEFKQALDDSIELMDRFIMKNGPATREELEARKEFDRALLLKPSDDEKNSGRMSEICKSKVLTDARRLYDGIKTVGTSEIRKGIEALLAIPRKPVMNPCL